MELNMMTEHRNVEPEPVWTGYDMSNQQLRYKWEEYKRWLEGEIATVKFTKVNGEERVMRCTLQESHLPKATKTRSHVYEEDPRIEPRGSICLGCKSSRLEIVPSQKRHKFYL